jgi:hypothetical protein
VNEGRARCRVGKASIYCYRRPDHAQAWHTLARSHKGQLHGRLRGAAPSAPSPQRPPFLRSHRGSLPHLRPLVGSLAPAGEERPPRPPQTPAAGVAEHTPWAPCSLGRCVGVCGCRSAGSPASPAPTPPRARGPRHPSTPPALCAAPAPPCH